MNLLLDTQVLIDLAPLQPAFHALLAFGFDVDTRVSVNRVVPRRAGTRGLNSG
jgi:hypothetical protein